MTWDIKEIVSHSCCKFYPFQVERNLKYFGGLNFTEEDYFLRTSQDHSSDTERKVHYFSGTVSSHLGVNPLAQITICHLETDQTLSSTSWWNNNSYPVPAQQIPYFASLKPNLSYLSYPSLLLLITTIKCVPLYSEFSPYTSHGINWYLTIGCSGTSLVYSLELLFDSFYLLQIEEFLKFPPQT